MEVKEVKFTPDQALQIILKGMETGQIKLPFNGTIKAEEMTAIAKNAIARRQHTPETDFYSLTYELAHSARLDSLYLLFMFGALTRGLTDKEVQNLNHLFDRFMY